jgi:hypothetical protein
MLQYQSFCFVTSTFLFSVLLASNYAATAAGWKTRSAVLEQYTTRERFENDGIRELTTQIRIQSECRHSTLS